MSVQNDKLRPFSPEYYRELAGAMVRTQEAVIMGAATAYLREHGRWPEYVWLRRSGTAFTAGTGKPPPGACEMYYTGVLNDRTPPGVH